MSEQVAGEQVEVLVHPPRESTSAALRAARAAAPRARIVLRDAYRRHIVVRFSGA